MSPPRLFPRRSFTIIRAMTRALPLLLLCVAARAAEVRVPSAPPLAHFDTESVTNAPLPAAVATARLLHCTVELTATSSNNVEVAFGRDADGDGALAEGEAAMRLGWDCGAWFLEGGTNRFEAAVAGPPLPARIELSLRVGESGVPVAWSCGSLTNMPAKPPAWLFSRGWDVVRLSVRGFSPRDELVSVRLDADASVLILR